MTRLQSETINALSKLEKCQQDKLIDMALKMLPSEKSEEYEKKLKEI